MMILDAFRQVPEVIRHLGHLAAVYPAEILSGGVRAAIAVERYHAFAQAIGVSRQDADRTLAESRRQLATWEWRYNPVDDAQRRLKLGVGSPRSRPGAEFRRLARERLAWLGERYTPADVDQLALRIECGLPL